MDKLQPFIKQRYWICFGLAVLFSLVGWWLASGAIAKETVARKDIVDKAFTAATQGATEPNEDWVKEAQKENASDNQAYNSASAQLWKRQQNARRWPAVIEKDLKGIPYQGQIKSPETRAKWASIYKTQIEELLAIVRPFRDGEGLVIVDESSITHKPFNSWRYGPPASPEIWNNQEDIWLLQSILTSIARVNEGATRLTESQVRQITKLTLRGGDRDAKPGASGGGGGGLLAGGGMGGGGMGMSGPPGGMGGPAGMGGGSLGGGGDLSVSYPGKEFEGSAGEDILAEEFGADPSGGGASGGMGMGGIGKGSMGMGTPSAGGGGAPAGGGKAAEEKRFVDEQPGYKTRAFLLDVVVRDDQLPNLLASLTNSDFPVEIVRVDITAGSDATSNSGAGGFSSGMGAGGGMGIGMGAAPGGLGMGEGAGGGKSSMGMAGGMPGGGGMLGGLGSPGGLGAGGGLGAPGMGMDPGMGMGSSSGDFAAGSGKGSQTLQAAMVDPLLVNVKIGGLMTLYQSAQESDVQAATEAAAVTEQTAPPTTVPVAGAEGDGAAGGVTPESQPAAAGAETDPSATAGAGAPATGATGDPAAAATGAPAAGATGDPAAGGTGDPAAGGTNSAAPGAGSGDPATGTGVNPATQNAATPNPGTSTPPTNEPAEGSKSPAGTDGSTPSSPGGSPNP